MYLKAIAAVCTYLAVARAEDCQLNGVFVGGACKCDIGWTGPSCGKLDLDPNPVVAYGYGSPNDPTTSSWGGGPPVYDPVKKNYHLFVTEIADHCGMGTWARMSQAVHGVSSTPEGPYTRLEVAIPTQTHNTYYAYSAPDKTHLIYSIFGGESPASCNPPFPNCTDGSTPGGQGGVRPRVWSPGNECPNKASGAHIHYSKSLDGPWLSAGPLETNAKGCVGPLGLGCGSSNPAPWILPNGTVLMIGRSKDATREPGMPVVFGHNLFLYRASSWNSTYEWVPGTGVNGSLNIGNGSRYDTTEDPVLWQGRRGFHALMHTTSDLTHAWSVDGRHWNSSSVIMGPPEQPGGPNERPRVFLDGNGDLAVVFVGQLVVAGRDASRTAAFRVRRRHT